MSLEDIYEIEKLKYRYLRFLDLRQWDDFTDCFVPDVTGDYAGLVFPSRDKLVDYMRKHMTDEMISMHHCHHPEIEVDTEGGTATGTWYLEDKVIFEKYKLYIEGASIYSDRYVRTEAGWKISHTGYFRTYEMMRSMKNWDDLEIDTRPRKYARD